MKTDSEIQKDVISELTYEPLINSAEIGVSVKNGIVTLSGSVDSYLKKITVENAAKRVEGVKAIAEDMLVKYTDSLIKSDTEVADAILKALKWHSALKEEKIKVQVENGVVTLEGQVEWEFQKRSAILQIENIVGIKKIKNNIMVKTASVAPKELKQKIKAALHRSATVDSENIHIDAIDHKVILTGKVRSLAEKNDAEDAVWQAQGINIVENKLIVESESVIG